MNFQTFKLVLEKADCLGCVGGVGAHPGLPPSTPAEGGVLV